MLPKGSAFLIAATTIVLLVHACVFAGGSKIAVAFCIFILMIGGPIALLAWFGSLSDAEARQRQQQRNRKQAKAEALLWQRTLNDMQTVYAAPLRVQRVAASAIGDEHAHASTATRSGMPVRFNRYPPSNTRRALRPILVLSAMVASAIGVAGCATEIPPEAWASVRPGMKTAELVALIGGPDYVRSNGAAEVWQYCRDSYGRDEGRNALYYTAILVDKQEIRDVQNHPVYSDAGCQAFYRASF